MSERPTAMSLLAAAHDALRARDYRVEVDGIYLRCAVGRQGFVVVANARKDGRLRIAGALVREGDKHVAPPGCDDSNVSPGSRKGSLKAVVEALDLRLKARLEALARCPHWADRQGFCHECGVCVEPDRHDQDDCNECRVAAERHGRSDAAFVDAHERELDAAE